MIGIVLILLSLSLVSAASPFTNPGTTEGIAIEHPITDNFKVHEEHKFHFHIFNISDGRPFLNNSNVKCVFHLYNQTGSHILKVNTVSSDDTYDWEQIVAGDNFSTPGQYAYVFQCNNSIVGGYYEHDFMVTPTGVNQYSVLNNAILIILGLFGFGLVIFGTTKGIPWFGFIGSIMFLLVGIYTMIYGFNDTTDMYTQSVALVFIGIGFIFMFLSVFEWLAEEEESWTGGDED